MNILILDVETTTSSNGHFADSGNKLVSVGVKWLEGDYYIFNTLGKDYRDGIRHHVSHADIIVGFNIKFDLHWLRNYGIDFSGKKIWDCQIAEFLFESQTNKYPSLNDTLLKYGYEPKLDIVKEMYWNKGIDTTEVPKDILHEYLARDLEATEEVFVKQKELFKSTQKSKYKLFQLQCADLLVLQEMEYNGLKFNSTAAREEANRIEKEMNGIEKVIFNTIDAGETPINLNSNDHLSSILYGGNISWTIKVADGVFKSGNRVGQIKYRNQEVSKEFPRLVEPLDKTETAKSKKSEGEANGWSVAEDVLRQLKAKGKAKVIIDNVLELSKMEKLRGTYLLGLGELIEKMNWPLDKIHGNLNQCSVVTGRLSSTKPNLQNLSPEAKKFFESRYI